MYSQKLVSLIPRLWPGLVALIIMLVPFQGTLPVALAHLVGHYTLLRLWKELLMMPLFLASVYLLAKDKKLRNKVFKSKITWLMAAYLAIEIIWGIVTYLRHGVTTKALGYALISDNRFLIFFLIVWVIASSYPCLKKSWPKMVFWPAAVVIVFGLLQYFILPYNFMTHLGYSAATIFPYEDINYNIHYIRIMSTLRGANPLGAYLIVIVSLALALFYKHKKWWLIVLAAGGLLAEIFSFSRASWIGLVLSLATLVWASLKSWRLRQWLVVALVACLIVGSLGALALRHNATVQNILLHSQTNSAIKTTSDQGHIADLEGAFSQLMAQPLGRGPGTAGPASVYNRDQPARIAENYFLQIGQATGWLGLIIFIAINVLVAQALWHRRTSPLALGLFAALIGISFANLLSPAWADDTLCYLWWGLAALVYASPLRLKSATRQLN